MARLSRWLFLVVLLVGCPPPEGNLGDDDVADDDDTGPIGSCRYHLQGELFICALILEADCSIDGAPPGVTSEWLEGDCPSDSTASCEGEDGDSWFFYLDQSSEMLTPYCKQCASALTPSDFCD